jgi:serine/threonine protein phosphatase 1
MKNGIKYIKMVDNIYIIGDIHGRFHVLKTLLNKIKFDYKNDLLIILGDIVDGSDKSKQVIDELIKIKNKVFIIGNHDYWYMNYIFNNDMNKYWLNQGGANTLNSYGAKIKPNKNINKNPDIKDIKNVKIPKEHINFLVNGLFYFIYMNNLFVHGGFNPNVDIKEQELYKLMWDRDLITYAQNNNIEKYENVFIGHTSTQIIDRNWINFRCRKCGHEWETEITKRKQLNTDNTKCPNCNTTDIFQSFGCTKPIMIGNLICMDTGAGWDGKLTIMNMITKEYWQSELLEPPILGQKMR